MQLNLSVGDAQTGLDDLRVSLNGGSTWSAWQPYAATIAATLPAGTGSRTVKVEVRNRAHGAAVFGDSITLTR